MPQGPPGLSGPTVGPFGPFIGPSQVRDAAKATISLWAPTYVAEAARRTATTLLPFNDWLNEAVISPTGGDTAPRWTVYCPGSLSTPHRDGDGTYRVVWDVQVNLWAYGLDWESTEDTLGWYLAALRMALLQHPSLGGFSEATFWRGERYEPIQETAFHTWGRAVLLLATEVDNVMDAYAGPSTPPVDPSVEPPSAPTATASQVTVTHF